MALEMIRAWERSTTLSVVNILQIERGNGAAANRLTLTDKPYYDKGVSGNKYHETYPAPHHCIISKILTDERRDATSFDDIRISNADGLYDGLAGSTNIIGQPFVMLRGDQAWSLLEDELPYRFVEIFRGNVLGVESEQAGKVIRIRIGPVRYDLDIRIGNEGDPKGFGQVFNAPLFLIDTATNRYRFNSFSIRSGSSDIKVYDNGELLVGGGTDYTVVTSGGLFFGTVDLVAPPAGTLTASYNLDYNRAADALSNIRFILNGAVDTSTNQAITESLDLSAQGDVWCMVEGEDAFYVVDYDGSGMGSGLVKRWTMTPGNLASAATGGATANLYTLCTMTSIGGIFVNAAETEMYVAGRDGSTRKVCLLNFGTAGNVTTLSLDSTKTITWVTANLADIKVNSAGTVLMLLTYAGIIYQHSLTAGDMTTLADSGKSIDAKRFDIQAWCFDIGNSGRYLYIAGASNGQVWQLELPTAWDFAEWVDLRRAENHTDSVSYLDPYFLHACADYLYVFNGSSFINKTPLTVDWMMSRNPVASNLYTTDCEVWAGSHASTLTPYGQVITELAASLACTYCIDRHGAIRLTQLRDPEQALTFEPNESVNYTDFLGDKTSYIQQTGTQLPARTVGLSFQRNVVVQREAELAGTLTQLQKYEFSTPVKTYIKTNTLSSWERSDDVYIDANTATDGTYPAAMADAIAAMRAVSRYTYELRLHLRAIPLLSGFEVGNVLTVGDDWQHPDFTAGDKLLCIGRRINWTDFEQTLTVLK
jgi:hypothetical protein